MADPNEILKEALSLKAAQTAKLINKLLSSLVKHDKDIDELCVQEAESRFDAYEEGKIQAVTLEKVLNAKRGNTRYWYCKPAQRAGLLEGATRNDPNQRMNTDEATTGQVHLFNA
jgi:hypothetical protein